MNGSNLRVLMITLGSHGDVHPFVALGAEVQRRGGAAAILTNPHFAPLVRAAGVELIPIGEAMSVRDVVNSHRHSMHSIKGPLVVLREMLAPMLGTMLGELGRAIAAFKPDVVLAHQLCIGSRWVCEGAGVPFVSVALAPCGWMNPNDVLAMTPFRPAHPSRTAVRFDVWMGKWVTGFALDGPLNAIRRQLGLKPGRHHWYTEMGAAGLNLGLWSPQFRGTLEGDPQGSRICGFPHFDHDPAQVRGEDALESFLNNGEPPVVFTLGTAVVHARPDFFELAAKAAAAVGCRTVLLTGSSDYAPSGLKEEAIAVPYARFSSLFPRARAVVHHGGIGTMAQAMGAGVPTLIVPAAHDQFDNAARAQRLGVSRTMKIAKITAASLATMLRTVIGDADIAERAGVLATQLSAERGASTAVDAILAYVRSPVHSPT